MSLDKNFLRASIGKNSIFFELNDDELEKDVSNLKLDNVFRLEYCCLEPVLVSWPRWIADDINK